MPLPRILFVTSELFPEFGYPTAGGGVRAANLFHSLQEQGFPVDLALARRTAEGKDLPAWATAYLYRPEFMDGLVEQASPDVVLSEGWEPLSHLQRKDQRVLIADCPGPLVLENSHRRVGDLRQNTFHKVRTLSQLDAILVPSRSMRTYLASFLTLAGWSPASSDRLLDNPISFPERLPARDVDREIGPVFFAGGVSWAWHQTADWLLRLADSLDKKEIGSIRTRFGKHPHHDLEGEVYEDLERRLSAHARITAGQLTDWDTLIGELTQADLAIEWSPCHLEREIASTLRIVTYLWCGLPVILRPHLDLAAEVKAYQAGWVLDSWEDLEALLDSLADHPREILERSKNAQRLATDRHSWPRGHESLFTFLQSPTKRESGPSFLEHATRTFRSQEEEIHGLRNDRKAWEEERTVLLKRLQECNQDAEAFRSLRQKLPYKLWKKITG